MCAGTVTWQAHQLCQASHPVSSGTSRLQVPGNCRSAAASVLNILSTFQGYPSLISGNSALGAESGQRTAQYDSCCAAAFVGGKKTSVMVLLSWE
jgi:hypothetical protein